MKNIFKKISISILAVFAAMFALGEAPLAYAASFNNDPLDYQTLRVGNSTQNPSYTSANWGTSVNANAGDILNFAIYYHNTSNETATNVRVTLAPQNSGTGTTQTFTATLTAGNVPTLTATATVYLSSSQSINYDPGFVTWRPNQTTYGSQTLLNSQTGAEIFSTGGLYLGDVGPGWSTQGVGCCRFQSKRHAVKYHHRSSGNHELHHYEFCPQLSDCLYLFAGSGG